MSRRITAGIVVGLVVALSLVAPVAAKKKAKKPAFNRPQDPVVMTGQALPRLIGESPAKLLAYRWDSRSKRPKKGSPKAKKSPGGRWVRVPVQVDERAMIDFGGSPFGAAPTSKTIYGTPPIGHSRLQYTDPGTFVGADPEPLFDGNDELVVMAKDAGDRSNKRSGVPKAALRGGATALTLLDPITGAKGWIYVFRAKRVPSPAPSDYVSYSFRLNSGDYRTTYDRADGPNPETSGASTAFYSVGFSDRWYFDQLRLSGGGAGADILDGYKFNFPGTCGRSEATFNDAEGAFIVNKDGPVRAIRSYVGANSGPNTQRTHFLYERRHEIVTDLRVHAVPGPQTHYDLSPAGIGMTYLNQARQAGVAVDGVPDAGINGTAPVDWHLWRGAPGSLFVADRITSSFALPSPTTLYEDNATSPSFTQCWGDADLLGAAGITSNGSIPNTDVGASDFLKALSVNVYGAPGTTAGEASNWSAELDRPISVGVASVKSKTRRKKKR